MKKFAFKAVGVMAIGAMAACGGGPSSPLSGTSWTSTANPSTADDNVTTAVYVMHFGVATTTTTTDATGPFTATLTVQHGATGNRAGCMDVTTLAAGTYDDTFSQTGNSNPGDVDITNSTVSTVSTGCMDTTENGTNTDSDSANGLPNNGGGDSYTVTNGVLAFSAADSDVPYDGAWSFMSSANP